MVGQLASCPQIFGGMHVRPPETNNNPPRKTCTPAPLHLQNQTCKVLDITKEEEKPQVLKLIYTAGALRRKEVRDLLTHLYNRGIVISFEERKHLLESQFVVAADVSTHRKLSRHFS